MYDTSLIFWSVGIDLSIMISTIFCRCALNHYTYNFLLNGTIEVEIFSATYSKYFHVGKFSDLVHDVGFITK